MASGPYQPFARVAPEANPAPLTREAANPDAFGAASGRALERVGTAAAQAGGEALQTATQAQNVFNEANVNRVQADYINRVTELLHKPATDADGTDGGFYSKHGDNALVHYEDFKKKMENLREASRSSLTSPRQQNTFDQLTRRMHDYQLQDMGRFVDREVNLAADNKTKATMDALHQQASMAGSAGNMQMMDESIDQGIGAAKSWGTRRGYGPEWGDKWARQWTGHTVTNVAGQMIQSNQLKEASELLARYQDKMDPTSVLAIKTRLKGGLEDAAANDWARNAVWGGIAGAPDTGAVTGRIVEVEGTGQNPRSSAAGVGQFTKSTWLDMIRSTRPDLSDQSDDELLKMRDDPKLAGAMVENYAQKNAQALQSANIEATPGNIYLSHFLGAGGAVKVLTADPATPVDTLLSPAAIQANPNLQGKTAGDVANWANAQMAGIKPTVAVKEEKAQTMARADAAFANDPAMLRKVHSAIERTYTAVQLDATARVAEAQARNETAANGYVQKMMKNETQGLVDQIGNDPNLTWQTRKSLWDMARTHTASDANHDVKTYGTGFYELYKRVHLPQGDPQRLTDPTELYSHVSEKGDLTLAGVNQLATEIAGKRTAQGEARSLMMKTFLENARGEITGTHEGLHLKDKKGDALYLKFLAQAFPAIEAGEKAGLTPSQLFNPDSKDYVGKNIASFKRPPAQWMSDMMSDGDGDTDNLDTQQGLIKAVQSGKISRADGEKRAIEKGWIRAPAVPIVE